MLQHVLKHDIQPTLLNIPSFCNGILQISTDLMGHDLLSQVREPAQDENEGVILIKPGGTFYLPCLQDILSRITRICRLIQVRVYSGDQVKQSRLFDRHYRPPTLIAEGQLPLTLNDYSNIHQFYAKPDFEDTFGVPYSDNLVEPAFTFLNQRLEGDEGELTRLWDHGRSPGLYWNKRSDGLNKIGFQKTVFPIWPPSGNKGDVRLVLNGYIPGYKKLFTAPEARTVALHVATVRDWRDVRDHLVGGSSNPDRCDAGSIRYDAFLGKIELQPGNAVVDGQRNVCHCSATLLDGMNELMIWFGLQANQTLVGRKCLAHNIPDQEIAAYIDGQLWEVSWWQRNDAIDSLIFEVRRPRVVDQNSWGPKHDLIRKYGEAAGLHVQDHSLIADVPSSSLIVNAARMKIAGSDYFEYHAGKVLRASNLPSWRGIFSEVVAQIAKLLPATDPTDTDAVRAEAVRIAASDLRLIGLPLYRDIDEIDSPELFRAQVIAELPAEALQCALRTERNFIRDVQARARQKIHSQAILPSDLPPINCVKDTVEWQALTKRPPVPMPPGDIVALIMSGGRSTRMATTLPKPLIPFGRHHLFKVTTAYLMKALEGLKTSLYAASGFRGSLLRRALGNRVTYLEFEKPLGVGFRVAACLHELRDYRGPVVLSYIDTPFLPSGRIRRLLNRLMSASNRERTFGLLTAPAASHVSGHVVRDKNDCVCRIVQERTDLVRVRVNQDRDAGLYVFYNTDSFRETMLDLKNDNLRREFVFADVVANLCHQNKAWTIIDERIEPSEALGINTPAELLCAVAGVHEDPIGGPANIRGRLQKAFEMQIDPSLHDASILEALLQKHTGPLFFFHWWQQDWT